jgi:rhodanese-related sulfurtransferase
MAAMYLSKEEMTYTLISPRETYELVQKDPDVLLLDVRTQAEFDNELGHAPSSMLIPLHELQGRLSELEPYRGKRIVAICRSGSRSGVAADLLGRSGYNAMNMSGGMMRWNREGLPVAREKKKG